MDAGLLMMHGRRFDIEDMRFDPQAGVTELVGSDDGRRKHGRLELEKVLSNFGPVMDLSASGAKVLARRVPKGVVMLQITGLGSGFRAPAKAAWSRKLGLFKHEVGFEFQDLTPEMTQQLTRLAMDNRTRKRLAG